MWGYCTAGHTHWGRHGAAGLLLADADSVLLQQRARLVHQGGTWSVPGGAVEAGETPRAAALREASEEAGIRAGDVEVEAEHLALCGGWPYVTVVARPLGPLTLRGNAESSRHDWVPTDEVEALPLHPAFRAAWPELRVLLGHVRATPVDRFRLRRARQHEGSARPCDHPRRG